MNKIFTQLLKKRGFTPDFLEPKYEDLTDPFELPDMAKAVARIKTAIKNSEKILIYGDYDADGVTASTVMEQALKFAGVKPENINIMLPDRFADGYGMSPRLINRAKDTNATLVITVDCGSRNHAIVEELNTLNINSIITDHHETEDTLPHAIALLNPKRRDLPCEKLNNLAGVGVAFKLAEALVKEGLIKNGLEKWLLDLVLIGTICDSMSLTGENRILCFYGLKVLAKTRRPGLLEICKKSRVKEFNSETVGFRIGPRLNAAGRLETAEIALNLLRTSSPAKAANLAKKVEELNSERKKSQEQAMRDIAERGIREEEPVIIETGPWHEGIVGIVAGRLVEKYRKPAFVLTETSNDIYKGSGRSFGDFNLAEALNYAKDAIISGGGHAGAAGVKVASNQLYAFREKINAYYDSLDLKNQNQYLKYTPDLTLDNFDDVDLDLISDLNMLEPFGQGNEEPIFLLNDFKISQVTLMGAEKNHLRIDFVDEKGQTLKAIAFFAPESWLKLTPDDHISVMVNLSKNDFNGVQTVQARIIDLSVL